MIDFSQFTATQPIADRLKKVILDATRNHDDPRRREGIAAIQRFERMGWQSVTFSKLFAEADVFALRGDGSLVYVGDDAVRDVIQLIDAYEKINGTTAQDYPTLPPDVIEAQVFDIAGAADYLGKSEPTIRSYIYQTKLLTGFKRGGVLLFTRAELDEFKARLPVVGRLPGTKIVQLEDGTRVARAPKSKSKVTK